MGSMRRLRTASRRCGSIPAVRSAMPGACSTHACTSAAAPPPRQSAKREEKERETVPWRRRMRPDGSRASKLAGCGGRSAEARAPSRARMDRSQSCGGADPPPPRARLIRPSIRLMISSIFLPCARALHARMDSKQKKKTRETGTKVPRFTQKKKKNQVKSIQQVAKRVQNMKRKRTPPSRPEPEQEK